MIEDDMSKLLDFVLEYLNKDEFPSAARVCSYWYQIIKDEKKWRSSMYCVVDKIKINYGIQWIFKNNRQHINFFDLTPCLQICFTNDINNLNIQDGCPCRTKRFSSFTVNLKSFFNMEHLKKTNPLIRFDFPMRSFAELTTYSFMNRSMMATYSNGQLYFDYDDDNEQLKTSLSKLSDIFGARNCPLVVLIILCQTYSFLELVDLLYAVMDWRFPLNEMVIWGATIDELSICRSSLRKHYCRIDTKLLLIFIRTPGLRTYTGCLDTECDSAEKIQTKLRDLKEEMQLSVKSIALMHVSYARLDEFYTLDTSIFEEVFPHVYLFPFYGDRSFNVSDVFDFRYCINRPPFKNMQKITTFIILTHD